MLEAISPIDGRYANKTKELNPYFSEYALIKKRVFVEIQYFVSLIELPLPQLAHLDKSIARQLYELYENFDIEDGKSIKNIEKTTNHDVKAVEYWLKEKCLELGLENEMEFIHFGLTSQDINNTSMPMLLKGGIEDILIPTLKETKNILKKLSLDWSSIPLLAHTHGQPASPTRLGKEILVFVERLEIQLDQLILQKHSAKFGGATGNLNAHKVSYPEINWIKFADSFVEKKLGLYRQKTTTQIEHYDGMAGIFQNLIRINTILIDLCRDIWTYISMNYFNQKVIKNEVGSSAMPHKVNPIDFENAEGNLMISIAIYSFLSEKLPISRLQRDLTDSTVLRNIGVPIAHQLIALKSIQKGLSKLLVNKRKIEQDLKNNWAVVAEAIQNILRREGYPKPYEKLKELTRTNEVIDEEKINSFIYNLDVSEDIKKVLRLITPYNYLGY